MGQAPATAQFNTSTDGGSITYKLFDNLKYGVLRSRVALAAAASGTLGIQLPANARPLWAQSNIVSAFTHSTATRYGVGTSADPDAYILSSTTTTAGTTTGPTFLESPGCIFSNSVASAAITNTNAATAFSFTGQAIPSIPANFLKPGDVIRINYQGIATATDSTDTLAIAVKVGSVTVSTQAANDVANNDVFVGTAVAVVRAVGSSGTLVAMDLATLDADADGDPAVGAAVASTTLDTSAAVDVSVTATWSVATLSNSCRLDILTIEVLRPALQISSSATDLLVSAVSNAGVQAGTTTGTVDVEIHFEVLNGIVTS
jgi:hypothetical protein